MKHYIVFFLFFTSLSFASDLKITNKELSIIEGDGGKVNATFRFTIEWNNSWRNDLNHDAVWLFFKIGNANNLLHAQVKKDGHKYVETISGLGPKPEIKIPDDRRGMFIFPSKSYRGNIKWSFLISLDERVFEKLNGGAFGGELFADGFGLEMVYVPKGSFFLGDPSIRATYNASFYKSNSEGEPDGLYQIKSEDEIEIAPSSGKLHYRANNPTYRGDQKGPIPLEFPKGYKAFYIMKYELNQGRYVEFLNALNEDQTQHRANFGGKYYIANRGTITNRDGKYYSSKPSRPLNYSSWDDGMAYADWAGLRPMTELEFTKASRGFNKPVENEYPWGTNSKNYLSRGIDKQGDLVNFGGLDEAKIDDTTKMFFGASYFWVMDLAGSLWERVVTIGHPYGRSFKGSHGDGNLDEYGFANCKDWPTGVKSDGGIGFRGGGFYEVGGSSRDFFPHSPIGYRPYGSWHGWNRGIAYGQRFVRTDN